MRSHLRKCPLGFYGVGIVKREKAEKLYIPKAPQNFHRGGSQGLEILHVLLIITRNSAIQDGQVSSST